jgi:hypothetical protein
MIKLPIMLLGLVGCIIPVPSMASNGTDIAVRSSVTIQVEFADEWYPIGSGTLVRDNEVGLSVLTAYHVASAIPGEYRACSVVLPEECVELGDYYMESQVGIPGDWALYPVDHRPKGVRPAQVSHQVPDVGDVVIQVGSPAGTPYVNQGTVAWTYSDMYMLDGFAYPGSSGGGVFDEQGRLIGITVAIPVFSDLIGFPLMMEDMPMVVPVHEIGIL